MSILNRWLDRLSKAKLSDPVRVDESDLVHGAEVEEYNVGDPAQALSVALKNLQEDPKHYGGVSDRRLTRMAASNAWDVFLDGKLIDTVFDESHDPEDVKRSLVDHDGYDHRIEVKFGGKGKPKRKMRPRGGLTPDSDGVYRNIPVEEAEPKLMSDMKKYIVSAMSAGAVSYDEIISAVKSRFSGFLDPVQHSAFYKALEELVASGSVSKHDEDQYVASGSAISQSPPGAKVIQDYKAIDPKDRQRKLDSLLDQYSAEQDPERKKQIEEQMRSLRASVFGRWKLRRAAPLDPAMWGDEEPTFWHGSPSGDLRGAKNGLHVGTFEAARQALEARIGVPAEGEWDGTRAYGETLLAGRKKMAEKGRSVTGFNCGAGDEDYYPKPGMAKYSDGTPVAMDARPIIAQYRIVGDMSNERYRPHEDFQANSLMRGQITRNRAKRGYYYTNVGEDAGSLSAVLPSGAHLERVSAAGAAKKHGHSPAYEKETAIIRENKKKPEASKPHDFKQAKWTFPNGHPRCLVCGGEEIIGGRCCVEPTAKDYADFEAELDAEFPDRVERRKKEVAAFESGQRTFTEFRARTAMGDGAERLLVMYWTGRITSADLSQGLRKLRGGSRWT